MMEQCRTCYGEITLTREIIRMLLTTLKQGSVGNAESNGIYNRFGVNNNLSNPVIKRFAPLVR